MTLKQIFILLIWCSICLGQDVFVNRCHGNRKCKEKIIFNVTVNTQLKMKPDYLKILRITEKGNGKNFTLINPVILKIKSYPPKLIYPLKLVQIVNSKPYEVFYHKDNTDYYPGCNANLLDQQCGQGFKGFCCNCDNRKENNPYHMRGGQECSTNVSSTHCIQYDPLWYSLNELEKPTLYHDVVISMTETGNHQVASTQVGNTNPSGHAIKESKISVTYSLVNYTDSDLLKYKRNILLIPQTASEEKSQFMLINKTWIGEECNEIGVSLEAFNNQSDKCHKSAQSCLENQPMQFWLEDMERKMKKTPREYFLQDRIRGVPKIIKSDRYQWSLVVPISNVQSILSISIPADDLLIVLKQFTQVIREIEYTDNSQTETLYIMLYNQGYIMKDVSVQLQNCNVTIMGEVSKSIQLPPHKTQHAELPFKTGITDGVFSCTLQVAGENDVDKWEITLHKHRQCICYPYRKCNCGIHGYYRHTVMASLGIFPGPFDPLFLLCVLIILLFIIGLVKAVLSLWSPISIGESGLCLFTKTRVLTTYHEPSLMKYEVIYNERGIPVDPLTKNPVQILPTSEIFLLNLCFGYYLLVIGLHWLMLRVLGLDTRYQYKREAKSWHQKLITPVTSPIDDSPADMGIHYNLDLSGRADDVKRKLFGSTDKQLVYEQYKKQKKELQKFLKNSVDEKEKDDLRKARRSAVKGLRRSLNRKIPLQALLDLDHVFFNYQRQSTVLKNSGQCYSLCGLLSRNGRRYKFELGPYNVQMCENIQGKARKLVNPQQIVHPLQFVTEMNATAVHQYITTGPLYPCLNTLITFKYNKH
ncbi:hapless 2-like isoform X3 [Mytilus edulis]|uniref:hapless 2-like isoform X3 n=1 Tax=Mytilus edulis TaxID=6550 RepID=UPI0039F0910B